LKPKRQNGSLMSSSHVISIRSAPLTLKLLKTSSCDGVSPATSDKNSNAVSASHVFTSLCVVIGTVEGISCLVLTYNMSTINTPVAHGKSYKPVGLSAERVEQIASSPS
jgi:hypothetical protein